MSVFLFLETKTAVCLGYQYMFVFISIEKTTTMLKNKSSVIFVDFDLHTFNVNYLFCRIMNG